MKIQVIVKVTDRRTLWGYNYRTKVVDSYDEAIVFAKSLRNRATRHANTICGGVAKEIKID